MGLGKSVITLTAMKELFDRGEISWALVVAPLRVARDTWPEEIRKWDHLQDLTFSVAVGTAEARRAALRRDVQIHIINRENLAWMAEYDLALLRLRPSVQRIVGLTGTPTGNGLMDLFGEYRVLDLGERLGRFISSYRKAYFLPDKMNAYQIFSWKPRPGAEEAIYRKISDITVSMKRADFLKMPECVMNEVKVFMEENERRLYDEMKEELFLRIPGDCAPVHGGPEGTVLIDAKNVAALCGKLSQMANGACYTKDGSVALIHDRKLDALEDLIEAANGHPVLIAYWYQHDLQRIRARFPETKALRSTADIADWNAGRIPVAAIHPASAGHGLNLQRGGNILIWYGLTWSLELYQQTNARLWRQGQQAETVTIHHIVTEGTIDEEILGALGCKDKTRESLIAAVKAQIPTKLKRRAG